jgi:hypothetical protein
MRTGPPKTRTRVACKYLVDEAMNKGARTTQVGTARFRDQPDPQYEESSTNTQAESSPSAKKDTKKHKKVRSRREGTVRGFDGI